MVESVAEWITQYMYGSRDVSPELGVVPGPFEVVYRGADLERTDVLGPELLAGDGGEVGKLAEGEVDLEYDALASHRGQSAAEALFKVVGLKEAEQGCAWGRRWRGLLGR